MLNFYSLMICHFLYRVGSYFTSAYVVCWCPASVIHVVCAACLVTVNCDEIGVLWILLQSHVNLHLSYFVNCNYCLILCQEHSWYVSNSLFPVKDNFSTIMLKLSWVTRVMHELSLQQPSQGKLFFLILAFTSWRIKTAYSVQKHCSFFSEKWLQLFEVIELQFDY